MEKRTKSRLAMLGILLAVGALVIGVGGALGAEQLLSGTGNEIKAVMQGNQVTIYEDDREIHNFTLPGGQNYTNYTWEISEDGDEIEIHFTDEEEADEAHEDELEDSNELNETEHESELNETLDETEEHESLNETQEDELEDSYGQETNETHEDELGETQGDGANGTQENETELHGSAGNSAQESGLDEEDETSEGSLELSLQSNETEGLKAED